MFGISKNILANTNSIQELTLFLGDSFANEETFDGDRECVPRYCQGRKVLPTDSSVLSF